MKIPEDWLDRSKIEVLESYGFSEIDSLKEAYEIIPTPDKQFAYLAYRLEQEYAGPVWFWRKETKKYFIYFHAMYDERFQQIKIGEMCYLSLKDENIIRELWFLSDGTSYEPFAKTFDTLVKRVEIYFSSVSEIYEFMKEYKDVEYSFKNYNFLHIYSRGVLFSIAEYIFFIESEILEPFEEKIDLENYVYDCIKNVFECTFGDIEKDRQSIRDNRLVIYSRDRVRDLFKTIEGIRGCIDERKILRDGDGNRMEFKTVLKVPWVAYGRFYLKLDIRKTNIIRNDSYMVEKSSVYLENIEYGASEELIRRFSK